MSFGWSAGDIALGIRLVGLVISSLRETGGAASEYQDLLKDLSGLQQMLQTLQSAEKTTDPRNSGVPDLITAHLQESAGEIKSFLESLKDFGESLGRRSKWHQSIPRKLQWTLSESKRLSKRYERLNARLNTAVTIHQIQRMYAS